MTRSGRVGRLATQARDQNVMQNAIAPQRMRFGALWSKNLMRNAERCNGMRLWSRAQPYAGKRGRPFGPASRLIRPHILRTCLG